MSQRKKILMTGASGLVGSSLTPFLEAKGYEITAFDRKNSNQSVENFFAIIHLAGKSIGDGRWTSEVKKEIYDSRIHLTKKLSEKIANAQSKPRIFISASAIGFYGNRGDEILDEESTSGKDGFLPSVCRDWETATRAAEEAKVRVIHPRFGIILSGEGGALQKMLTPFKWGVGAALGTGNQWMSWIAIEDVISAIYFLLDSSKDVNGPINFVSPQPATNLDFSKNLAHLLHRPLAPKVPAFMLKLMFGEMAEELLLSSAKVTPKKLQDLGFSFAFADLEKTLSHCLNR